MKYLILFLLSFSFSLAHAQQGVCSGVINEVACEGVTYSVHYGRSQVMGAGYMRGSIVGSVKKDGVRYFYTEPTGDLSHAIFVSSEGEQLLCEIASCRL